MPIGFAEIEPISRPRCLGGSELAVPATKSGRGEKEGVRRSGERNQNRETLLRLSFVATRSFQQSMLLPVAEELLQFSVNRTVFVIAMPKPFPKRMEFRSF